MSKRSNKWKVKWGYIELEIFPSHRQVVISQTKTGENVVMSAQGFKSICKGFMKRWKQYKGAINDKT